MNYNKHIKSIKEIIPELDLLKESEFYFFKNEHFALDCIKSCLELSNHISEKLKITLYFSIQYNHTFNAKAIVKDNCGIILLNLGLIDKLESIISNSVEIFSKENIAALTIPKNEKLGLKTLLSNLCLSYLFYHELAHVLQMLDTPSSKSYNFQEQYSDQDFFKIKNHIYELDADHFGVSMCSFRLLEYAKKISDPINIVLLFNLLTALLFSISSIIIEFSENKFENIYYKNYSHPHPLIRILECNEQILFFISNNLVIKKEFLLVVLQRTFTIIDQIHYSNKGQINYSNLIDDNIVEIELYNDEISTTNESFEELVRYKVQHIFNLIIKEYPHQC